MEWRDLISILTSVISICTLTFIFIWRKKDFQINLVKEQVISYRLLMNNLFETTESIKKLHGKKFAEKFIKQKGEIDEEDLHQLQLFVFIEFKDSYATSYDNFQKQIFLLPADVIDAAFNYFKYLGDLFENQNDSNLSMKLHLNLNQKTYAVVEAIRKHLVVDDLTDNMVQLLSKGNQLEFADSQNNSDL